MESGLSLPCRLHAPAKVNLSLKVLGRRSDGFHEIESLVVPIALCDFIEIDYLNPSAISDKTKSFASPAAQKPHAALQKIHTTSLTNSSTLSPTPHQVTYVTQSGEVLEIPFDSVSRALQFFSVRYGTPPPLSVKVTKNIPLEGGLGGSSTDAGTLLGFLREKFEQFRNTLAGQNSSADLSPSLKGENFVKESAEIGGDVPFFVSGKPAWIKGMGDEVLPLSLEAQLPPFAMVIAKPNFGISAAQAYRWFDETQAESGLTRGDADATKGQVKAAGSWGLPEILKILKNDLEKPVETRHPEIGILKKALSQWGALGTLMSGSGSSVFGIFRTLTEAQEAREKLQPNFPPTYAFFACEALTQKR